VERVKPELSAIALVLLEIPKSAQRGHLPQPLDTNTKHGAKKNGELVA
jgi:hypothetical protein